MRQITYKNIIVFATLFALAATLVPFFSYGLKEAQAQGQPSTQLEIRGGTFNYQTGPTPQTSTASASGTIQPSTGTGAAQFQSQCAGSPYCSVDAQLGLTSSSSTASGYNIVNPHTGEYVGPEGGPPGLQSSTTTTTASVYTGSETNLDPVCRGGMGGLTCNNIEFDFDLAYNQELSEQNSETTSTGNTHAQPNENAPFEQYSVTETTPLSVDEELTYLLLSQKSADDQPQDYEVNILP